MAQKINPKQAGVEAGKALKQDMGRLVHALDKDDIRRKANNTTVWSLASGGDDSYNKRYMDNIAKGEEAVRQRDLRDKADSEMERLTRRPSHQARSNRIRKMHE